MEPSPTRLSGTVSVRTLITDLSLLTLFNLTTLSTFHLVSMDTSIISARGSPRNAGPRGVTASPISRFLGSVHVKPTRTRQFSGLHIEVGDQQGTRISDRNLEAKGCRLSPASASASAIGEMARARPGFAGAQSTPTAGGRPERGGLGMAFHLSRICPSNPRSRLAHCRRRRLCFPIPPASGPVPAVLAHACDAGARS